MVNNTVNNIGKAAGNADKTIITGMQVVQTKRELEAPAKVSRTGGVNLEEFMTIKAYPGGNPNKARNNDELTH